MTASDDDIARLLRTGVSGASTAASLGIDPKRVLRVAKRHGIELPSGRGYRAEVKAEAIGLLRSGMTLKQVSDSTRIGVGTLRQWRTAAGIPDPLAPKAKDANRKRADASDVGTVRTRQAWTPGQRATILDAVREGASIRSTCEQYRIAQSTLRAWVREDNVTISSGMGFAPSVRESAVAAIEAGRSVAAVAKGHGCTDASVRQWCKDAGVRVRGSKYSDDVRGRALALVAELGSAGAAGRELGIPQATVAGWCERAGIDLSTLAIERRQRLRERVVVMLRDDGAASAKVVADVLGVHETTVCAWAREEGIELRRGVTTPIAVRDLDELRIRSAEIIAAGKPSESHQNQEASHAHGYRAWCLVRSLDRHHPGAVACYIDHQRIHGRSGRAHDWGQATGWSESTCTHAARAIGRMIVAETGVDVMPDRRVQEALARAEHLAPTELAADVHLSTADLAAIAATPAPTASFPVLVARAAVLLAHHEAEADGNAMVRAICTSPTASVRVERGRVALQLAGTDGPRTVFVHSDPDPLVCAHCAVLAVHEHAVSSAAPTLGGHDVQMAMHNARRAWDGGVARAGLGRGRVVPPGVGGLTRLSYHLSKDTVRWAQIHAILAVLVMTAWPVGVVLAMDVGDVEVSVGDDGIRRWRLYGRHGDVDRHGRRQGVGADSQISPGFDVVLTRWWHVRTPGPGPCFIGDRPGTPLDATTLRVHLRAMAAAAGVDATRLGTRQVQDLALRVLAARKVHPLCAQSRTGVTAERIAAATDAAAPTTELLDLEDCDR